MPARFTVGCVGIYQARRECAAYRCAYAAGMVRFQAEPDLTGLGKEHLRLSWKDFPSYAVNERFAGTLQRSRNQALCAVIFPLPHRRALAGCRLRSDRRRIQHCYNVTDGFEGPLNENHQRGFIAGWKASGLQWRQS